jgi:DNA-binding CsgD family transcriptional regulator
MTMLAPHAAPIASPGRQLTPFERQRLTPLQREVFSLIAARGQISYTDIAAELYIHRDSVITAIRQLEHHQLIEKVAGHGRVPNRYLVKEAHP